MEGGAGFVRSARSPFQSYAEREVLDRAFLPILRLADYFVGGVSGSRHAYPVSAQKPDWTKTANLHR